MKLNIPGICKGAMTLWFIYQNACIVKSNPKIESILYYQLFFFNFYNTKPPSMFSRGMFMIWNTPKISVMTIGLFFFSNVSKNSLNVSSILKFIVLFFVNLIMILRLFNCLHFVQYYVLIGMIVMIVWGVSPFIMIQEMNLICFSWSRYQIQFFDWCKNHLIFSTDQNKRYATL